jgi:hypothetical protein
MKEKDYNYANEIVKDASLPYQQNRRAGKFSLLKMILQEQHKNTLTSNVVKESEKNKTGTDSTKRR